MMKIHRNSNFCVLLLYCSVNHWNYTMYLELQCLLGNLRTEMGGHLQVVCLDMLSLSVFLFSVIIYVQAVVSDCTKDTLSQMLYLMFRRGQSTSCPAGFWEWFGCGSSSHFCLFLCVIEAEGDWQVSAYPGPLRQLWRHHCRALVLIEGWLDSIRGEGGREGHSCCC